MKQTCPQNCIIEEIISAFHKLANLLEELKKDKQLAEYYDDILIIKENIDRMHIFFEEISSINV